MSERTYSRTLRWGGAAFLATTLPIFAATLSNGPAEAPGVVAHWRFQGGVKNTAAAKTHIILDSSGNDRHGLAIGNPRFRGVELPGSNLALLFRGGDDRVFVPDDAMFHLTKSMTLEAYVEVNRYPVRAAKLGYVLFRGDNRPGRDPWYLGVASNGQLVFQVADATGKTAVVRSEQQLPIGRFVHIAGTLDHATGMQSLFIGGKRIATREATVRAYGPLTGAGPGVGIGCVQAPSNQVFYGSIDEVRVSRVALTPEQFLPRPDTIR